MDVAQLEQFLVLAEQLHYRRAAEMAGVSASTLSRQISDLEAEVGARLFERNRRGVRLTPAGASYLPEAQEALHRLRYAAAEARRIGSGSPERLRVGHSDAGALLLLRRSLPVLRAAHPDVHLQVIEAPSARLIERLGAGSLDLAMLRPPLPPTFAAERLCDEPFVVALPADSPLAGRRRLRPGDLAGHPLVVPDRSSAPGAHDAVMAALGPAGADRIAAEASTTSSILLLVGAGIGAGLIPEAAARHHDVPGVEIAALAGRHVVELWAAWRDAPPGSSLLVLLDAVRSAIASPE